MKKLPIYIALMLAATASCKKQQISSTNAVIVGWNNGYCATCGGFYLNLSDDTVKNANTDYVVNYASDLNSTVAGYAKQYNKNPSPIYVVVEWGTASDSIPQWIRLKALRSR